MGMARGSKTIRITYPFLPSARERFHAGLTSRQQRRDAGTLHRMRTFHVSRHFTTGLESIFHTNTRSRQKEFFHLSLRQVYVDDVTVLHFLIRRGMIAKPGAVKQEREEWRQREREEVARDMAGRICVGQVITSARCAVHASAMIQ